MSLMTAPSAQARILLVEDDEGIGVPLTQALGAQGYTVQWATTGGEALQQALTDPPELVLLDLGLPDLDGVTVCRELREKNVQASIVMLTARDTEIDIVVGLDAGADDYITKPFRLAELLARVRAHLRRMAPAEQQASVVDALVVDTAARRVAVDGTDVPLRPKEFDLLAELAAHAGEAVGREQLMTRVWDEHWFGSTKTLDMHVSALRHKLEAAGDSPRRITTLRGFGYRLEHVG